MVLAVVGSSPGRATDLAVVPLLDGERGSLVSNWGGPFSAGNIPGVSLQSSVVHSGQAAYRADLGAISASGFGFFQSFSSEPTGIQGRRQTRDLTRYDGFEAYVRNDTGTALNLQYEIKDYRDDLNHRATRTFSIPANSAWTRITAPLDMASPGWAVQGAPDLSRTYVNSFVVSGAGSPVSGSLYLDDFRLFESGGPIDIETAPLATLVERLAQRQFAGLWSGRNRTTGLIYNHKDDVDLAAMNTTGGTLWVLPKAVERGWVSQAEADATVAQIAAALSSNLNQTSYLPTRFVRPDTAGLPGGGNEESSIDASFIGLALDRYKQLPTTSASLAQTIDTVQNRFELDAFAVPAGFRLAYYPATGFTPGTYNGYTNEGKVISLAAEVSDAHHVPLETHWNADTARARAFLVDLDDAHLVHASTNFRAPFEQALLNLFVDTSERGVDNYSVRSQATNPWENFERYHREVDARLLQLGRENFYQPDAASGAPLSGYEQYSLYNDFGQADLFMPWSTSFALLAGSSQADAALRTLLLQDGISGPLGLADSVRWTTGATGPSFVSNSGDNWNTVLSTMALMEWLDRQQGNTSSSQFMASLDRVDAALDRVFVDGDLDGNAVTDAADLAIWETRFGLEKRATPVSGDTDGDADVDGADFLRWQRGFGTEAVSGGVAQGGAVPESSTAGLAAVAALLASAVSPRRAWPGRGGGGCS
jgi:hypothetical protein